MKKYIESLHFITQDLPNKSHFSQAQSACEAGAKWIQYRCLSKKDEDLLTDLNAIAQICDDWGTTLIVTNHVHLAGQADIQGFHIEDTNIDFIGLRKKLGDNYTLGATAHNLESCITLAKTGADYITLGPFAISNPNRNLDSLTFKDIISKLKSSDLTIPILAFGDININNVQELMTFGIYGVSISTALNASEDFEETYQEFYTKIKNR